MPYHSATALLLSDARALPTLSQRTGYWGFQRYPVICGLSTTRLDGQALLQGRRTGTFLLRLSSRQGFLAVMCVKEDQQASRLTRALAYCVLVGTVGVSCVPSWVLLVVAEQLFSPWIPTL